MKQMFRFNPNIKQIIGMKVNRVKFALIPKIRFNCCASNRTIITAFDTCYNFVGWRRNRVIYNNPDKRIQTWNRFIIENSILYTVSVGIKSVDSGKKFFADSMAATEA